MSRVTPDEIERISQLASLQVEADALPALTAQIAKILEYVSQLEAVTGSSDAATLARPDHPSGSPLRSDGVHPPSPPLRPQAFAPAFQDGLFVVPKLGAMEDEE